MKNSFKKIIHIIVIAFSFVACQSTTHNLGEQFVTKNPISVDSALTILNTTSALKDVQVEGTINKSCMSEGCWLTIKDNSGTEILFNIADKKFTIPMDSPGKAVVVLVDEAATKKNAEGKELPKNELYIKGLLFK